MDNNLCNIIPLSLAGGLGAEAEPEPEVKFPRIGPRTTGDGHFFLVILKDDYQLW